MRPRCAAAAAAADDASTEAPSVAQSTFSHLDDPGIIDSSDGFGESGVTGLTKLQWRLLFPPEPSEHTCIVPIIRVSVKGQSITCDTESLPSALQRGSIIGIDGAGNDRCLLRRVQNNVYAYFEDDKEPGKLYALDGDPDDLRILGEKSKLVDVGARPRHSTIDVHDTFELLWLGPYQWVLASARHINIYELPFSLLLLEYEMEDVDAIAAGGGGDRLNVKHVYWLHCPETEEVRMGVLRRDGGVTVSLPGFSHKIRVPHARTDLGFASSYPAVGPLISADGLWLLLYRNAGGGEDIAAYKSYEQNPYDSPREDEPEHDEREDDPESDDGSPCIERAPLVISATYAHDDSLRLLAFDAPRTAVSAFALELASRSAAGMYLWQMGASANAWVQTPILQVLYGQLEPHPLQGKLCCGEKFFDTRTPVVMCMGTVPSNEVACALLLDGVRIPMRCLASMVGQPFVVNERVQLVTCEAPELATSSTRHCAPVSVLRVEGAAVRRAEPTPFVLFSNINPHDHVIFCAPVDDNTQLLTCRGKRPQLVEGLPVRVGIRRQCMEEGVTQQHASLHQVAFPLTAQIHRLHSKDVDASAWVRLCEVIRGHNLADTGTDVIWLRARSGAADAQPHTPKLTK